MKLLVALVVVATCLMGSAQADLLCVKSSVKASKSGKVALGQSFQSTTDSRCPAGFQPVFDTAAVAAVKGPPGPQGVPGIVNIFACHVVTQNTIIFGGDDFESISSGCPQSEFMLTHAGSASSINVDIISTSLQAYPNEPFPSGVTYYFGRNNVGALTDVGISASAVCCPR